jgi:hypothetical protein
MTDAIGKMSSRGDLGIKLIRPNKPGLLWQLRNIRHSLTGRMRKEIADLFGIPTFYAELRAVKFGADGKVTDYGVISTLSVTTAFVAALATYMFDGSGVVPTAYDYHDCGTGTNAENITDVALQTAYGGARTNGTPTNPGSGQYRSVGLISFSSGFAITEHGLFSAAAAGTLMDRSVFAAINVVNGDSIQFTYTWTASAGG